MTADEVERLSLPSSDALQAEKILVVSVTRVPDSVLDATGDENGALADSSWETLVIDARASIVGY